MTIHRRVCSAATRAFPVVCVLVLSGFAAEPAGGTVILSTSGLSKKNVPVTFEAQLTISANTLTVKLINDSPVNSLNPDDLLASFYFDIRDGGGTRPTLLYASATGDLYLANKDGPDTLQTPGADLQAFASGDDTWQFRTMDPSQAPFLGFGIGTVGNSAAAPNNFQGNIVGAIESAIYRGEITTNNLKNRLLVKDTATFSFTGVSGFSEGDIVGSFAFGLGTAPDSFLVPEPSTVSLLLVGVLAIAAGRRRHRRNASR